MNRIEKHGGNLNWRKFWEKIEKEINNLSKERKKNQPYNFIEEAYWSSLWSVKYHGFIGDILLIVWENRPCSYFALVLVFLF